MARLLSRRLWLKIHLYLGLTAGAVLMLLGITGSILVFSDDIDRALNPRLAASVQQRSGPKPSLDEVFSSVEKHAGSPAYVLELPVEEGAPYLAFVSRPNAGPEPVAVHVNSDTAEVVASRQWGTSFVSFARRFHTEFLVEGGHWFVGACGLLALISAGTGLYLWWPRGGAWRRALKFHRPRYAAAMNFELHRICGFYLFIVLFVVSLSGIYLAVPEPFDAALSETASLSHGEHDIQSASPPPGAQRLTLTAVAGVLDRYSPGSRLTGFDVPADDNGAFTAYYRDPREPNSAFGRSSIRVDQYSGKVLYARPYPELATTDKVLSMQFLLHNGEIAGTLGRWLVFVCGLLPALLFVTGFYLWWIRR